jgi:hypothetical protein
MTITWSDLGKPTKPGRYIYQDYEVVVDPNAIGSPSRAGSRIFKRLMIARGSLAHEPGRRR